MEIWNKFLHFINKESKFQITNIMLLKYLKKNLFYHPYVIITTDDFDLFQVDMRMQYSEIILLKFVLLLYKWRMILITSFSYGLIIFHPKNNFF